MATYVFDFSHPERHDKQLLGGKGANLAEMTRLGLPVPPGFTITTEACRYLISHDGDEPKELRTQVTGAMRRLEDELDRQLGDAKDPLLVSVRSGAASSMPGMMDTILNVGLNDEAVGGLAEVSGDERFAWDSYRRLISMFSRTVLGVDAGPLQQAFEAHLRDEGVEDETGLDADALRGLVDRYKKVVQEETGRGFPQQPREQLDLAIRAVFGSWNTERARLYRRRERIPHDLGTAVNVCAMVFGNLGEDSGTGVAFTRDPATGDSGHYGDYLPDAQGEDVVAGTRNTLTLDDLAERHPKVAKELHATMRKLETHYRDLCDIEFTVEHGRLWMLQTRVGKRTAAAAFRVAVQLWDEGLITADEALARVSGKQLALLLVPRFAADAERSVLVTGIAASPGAAVGKVVFEPETAVERTDAGNQVILVRRETSPDDLAGMVAATGILTARGGKTSHAAVVARGMGKPAVCGTDGLTIDEENRTATAGKDEDGEPVEINEGDVISIDGATGEVFLGEVEVVPPPVVRYLEQGLDAVVDDLPEQDAALVRCVDRLLEHADDLRRLRVRANADTAEDAVRARQLGAEGIGLCRTEHMFLGDRRVLIERVVLADSAETRDKALEALLPMQRADFVELLEAMDDLPITVRLLDPPLHEFLPDRADLMVKVALASERGEDDKEAKRLLAAVNRTYESNPMLGLRGVRLGLVVPGLYALQVRALAEATAERLKAGGKPRPEIMVPLVGSARELQICRAEIVEVLAEVGEATDNDLSMPIGTMIELPRAALTARRIAGESDFFSFGTNDLTQTTWGFSRDDVEAAFFAAYLEKGVFTVSPFETIDGDGVGRLVQIAAAEGRDAKSDLKVGVCGEHGGDPESIHFFDEVGLDYVSASPFRVPVARLEAGRATVDEATT